MEIYEEVLTADGARNFMHMLPASKYSRPDITSKTADSVLGNMSGGQCEVNTLFEMDVFAAGASSLSTLTKLMDQGHRLFHLPNLHAKLVALSRPIRQA